MTSALVRKASLVCLALLIISGLTVLVPKQNAEAYETSGLILNFDASDPTSFNTSTLQLTNIAPGGSVATKVGNITYDAATQSINFPGGSNATNYYNVGSGFANFGTGITIEANFSFGASVSFFERIIDFGNGPESDNFWIGQHDTTGQLEIETFNGNLRYARCRTNEATPPITSNTFSIWTITLDGTTCRIYKDGVEQNTLVEPFLNNQTQGTTDNPNSLGSSYPYLPANVNRTINRLGASNWSADPDTAGKLKYLRIYTTALTPSQVNNNVTNPSPSASPSNSQTQSSGSGNPAPAPSPSPVLAATGASKSNILVSLFLVIFGSVLIFVTRRKILI